MMLVRGVERDVGNESGLRLAEFATPVNFTAWPGLRVLGKDSSHGSNLVLFKTLELGTGSRRKYNNGTTSSQTTAALNPRQVY